MTFTTKLLEDHKGFTGPKAVGDEYCVDAAIQFTVYHRADRVTAEALGLSTISAVMITGLSAGLDPIIVVDVSDDADGSYDGQSFKVMMYDGSVADEVEISNAANIDDTTVRVRVYGNK